MKLKRICAGLLTTIMLNGYNLNAKAEIRDNVTEKLLLTKEEQSDSTYSYMLPDRYEKQLNDDGIELFNNLVNAVLNHKDKLKLSKDDKLNTLVCKALYYSNYNLALEEIGYDSSNNTVYLTYLYSKEDTLNEIKSIDTNMNKIYDEIFEDDMSTLDKLIMLYYYAEQHFGYCFSYPKKYIKNSKALYIPISYLLENNKGVCHTYAQFFNYFCEQNGIESYLLMGNMAGQKHMWNLIRLDDGKLYMFDLTKSLILGKTLQNSFTCFGITNLEFMSYGYTIDSDYQKELLNNETLGEIPELRNFLTLEYLGNHNYKLVNKFGKIKYFNSETREVTESMENEIKLSK